MKFFLLKKDYLIFQHKKEVLENFFKYTIIASTFGYTLYGDKPMSIESFNIQNIPKSVEGIDYMDESHLLDKYRLKEGWDTWEKYRHLFKLKNYSLISYPFSNDQVEICLINHEAFINVVKENIKDFQDILGASLTPEEVLEGYLSGRYFKQIQSHDALLGVLLGYGADNSWKYWKNAADTKLSLFNKEKSQDRIFVFLPMFKADFDTKETQALELKYLKQREQIETIYKENQFLIPSLARLEGY